MKYERSLLLRGLKIIKMKKCSLLILTLFILFAGCDFIPKKNTSQNKISNTNVKLNFHLTSEKKESHFDKYLKYCIDASGPIVVLIGIILTLPLIRKKLVENHITNALDEIQKTNTKVLKYNQKLIDKYRPLTYTDYALSKNEIEKILQNLKQVFYFSQSGSSDVVSILFYLKSTIQGTLKHYDSTPLILLSSRDIYGLVISTLNLANFYCTQVVQIPKSAKTINLNIINKKIRKYVSHTEYLKYKYFSQGVIHDPNSSHFILFYNIIDNCGCPLITRAAFQIYLNTAPILKNIYINKIYAPLELENNEVGIKNYKVYLIGVKFNTQISVTTGKKYKYVDLIYSNPNDVFRFASNLPYQKVKDDFKDSFMPDSKFELIQAKKMSSACIETFTLQFDRNYLEESFKKNKKEMKRKMKII